MSLRSFVIALPFLGLIYSWVPCPCTICPCAPLSLCSLVLTLLCPCVPLSSHSFVFTLLFCFALLFFASLSLRSFFLVLLFPYAPLYLRSLVLTLLCPYAPLSLRSFVLTLLCPYTPLSLRFFSLTSFIQGLILRSLSVIWINSSEQQLCYIWKAKSHRTKSGCSRRWFCTVEPQIPLKRTKTHQFTGQAAEIEHHQINLNVALMGHFVTKKVHKSMNSQAWEKPVRLNCKLNQEERVIWNVVAMHLCSRVSNLTKV